MSGERARYGQLLWWPACRSRMTEVHIKSCTAQISKNINFGTLPNFCPWFQRAKVDIEIISIRLIHRKIIHKSMKYRVNHKIIHIIHRFVVISYVNHTLSSRTFILWIFPSDIMSYPEYRTLRQHFGFFSAGTKKELPERQPWCAHIFFVSSFKRSSIPVRSDTARKQKDKFHECPDPHCNAG